MYIQLRIYTHIFQYFSVMDMYIVYYVHCRSCTGRYIISVYICCTCILVFVLCVDLCVCLNLVSPCIFAFIH